MTFMSWLRGVVCRSQTARWLVRLVEQNQSIINYLESIVGQTEDLRAAVAQVGVDLGEAVARVEAKIVALGEPDADLSADIAKLKEFSATLDSIATEAPETDEPPPVEPPDTTG